jgi:predicted DNA-binding protein
MFPVRLPDRDHRRLKAWCERHNFPMAVVVRGLIERFLDQQEEPPAA